MQKYFLSLYGTGCYLCFMAKIARLTPNSSLAFMVNIRCFGQKNHSVSPRKKKVFPWSPSQRLAQISSASCLFHLFTASTENSFIVCTQVLLKFCWSLERSRTAWQWGPPYGCCQDIPSSKGQVFNGTSSSSHRLSPWFWVNKKGISE